jgi:secretion/DNA translocation related CpaE-like protein
VSSNRPVAFVEDDSLLDEVLKLAAAAGCSVERVPDSAAARARWASAPMVILDPAAMRDCVDSGLSRRGSIFVVCAGEPPHEVWVTAVALGVERVIWLPEGESWLVGALADAAEAPAGTKGKVLAVVGGRGGAGSSVFAASVGLTVLRGGTSALLIDCDPLGGGLDLVLGAETENGLRWPDMHLHEGRVAASSLHSALPGRMNGSARLTMLSGAREGMAPEPDAVIAVLEAGRRAGETVICDLSRLVDGGAQAAMERADLSIVVVPAEVRACVSAALVARRMIAGGAHPQLIVRGPAPGGLTAEEVAKATGIPLLTSMRPEPNLARLLENGEFHPRPHGPLAKAARATLRALATQPTRDLRAAS